MVPQRQEYVGSKLDSSVDTLSQWIFLVSVSCSVQLAFIYSQLRESPDCLLCLNQSSRAERQVDHLTATLAPISPFSLNLQHWQCDFITLPIKTVLFSFPLNWGSQYDLHGHRNAVGAMVASSQPAPWESLCAFPPPAVLSSTCTPARLACWRRKLGKESHCPS